MNKKLSKHNKYRGKGKAEMNTLGAMAKITVKDLSIIKNSVFIHDTVNIIANYQNKVYMNYRKRGGNIK